MLSPRLIVVYGACFPLRRTLTIRSRCSTRLLSFEDKLVPIKPINTSSYLPRFLANDAPKGVPVVPLPLADHLFSLPPRFTGVITPTAAIVQAEALTSRLSQVRARWGMTG